jgi:hypothetical protein
MAQVNEVCVFTTKADQVKFMTQTNGDELHILKLTLSQEQATSLAWLINSDEDHELEIKIRIKP